MFQTDRNGSSPIFGTNMPSIYTGPFWNRSGTNPNGSNIGPAVLQVQFWIQTGPVPKQCHINTRIGSKRFHVNTWIGSERFHVNRSRSGPVRLGTVSVRSCVNAALKQNFRNLIRSGSRELAQGPSVSDLAILYLLTLDMNGVIGSFSVATSCCIRESRIMKLVALVS